MAERIELKAHELHPGDLITWSRGMALVVCVLDDPKQPEIFLKLTIVEPWPYILGTYDLFRDDDVHNVHRIIP